MDGLCQINLSFELFSVPGTGINFTLEEIQRAIIMTLAIGDKFPGTGINITLRWRVVTKLT